MTNNDFAEVLLHFINQLNLPLVARLDYLNEQDDLVIYSMPGGKVEEEDMAGNQVVSLPFEIAIKSKNQELTNGTLWQINKSLSAFDLELPSENGSYQYQSLSVETPSLNDINEQGYYIYLLDITARLEIERNIYET